MKFKHLWKLFFKVACSLLFAAVFYTVWLSAFLQVSHLGNSVVEAIGMFLAPVTTAAGFAAGIAIYELLTKTEKTRFFSNFLWPLVGCAVGFGAVYWYGPMLIVFGMFVAGAASVTIRELLLILKKNKILVAKGQHS